MKRIFIAFCMLILLTQSAFAVSMNEYPVYNGEPVADNKLGIEVEGVPVLMDFDSSTDYSYVYNNTIQACFFAYNTDNTAYVEVYLILPESIAEGDTIDPDYCVAHGCSACSVTFTEATTSTEDYYTAFSVNGAGYPAGCDYSIKIDQYTKGADSVTISGTITAVLNKFDGLNTTDQFLNLKNANFNCTVKVRTDAAASPTPDNTAAPDAAADPFAESPLTPETSEPSPTPFAVKV